MDHCGVHTRTACGRGVSDLISVRPQCILAAFNLVHRPLVSPSERNLGQFGFWCSWQF